MENHINTDKLYEQLWLKKKAKRYVFLNTVTKNNFIMIQITCF